MDNPTANMDGHDADMAAFGRLVAENARLREELAAAQVDAARYRWLRETLHGSVGGGVEVNDEALVYEKPAPGKEVRVYWYPNTPVGFYESHGETLDAAIDAAMKEVGHEQV